MIRTTTAVHRSRTTRRTCRWSLGLVAVILTFGVAGTEHVRASGEWWSQIGGNLVATGGETFGSSVALSADGNTAIVGAGAKARVFVRSAAGWAQLGSALDGRSVDISADGHTVIVGLHSYGG